ncbi:MAG: riboflavin synthase [Acidimicrobiales bacterium]
MFTGIVEELARLSSAAQGHVVVTAELADELAIGDSVAVNGCCLTVVERGPGWWAADVVAETLSRTTLGALQPGDPVNLERPVRLADRLGGHLVQGHVDAVGSVHQAAPDLVVSLPDSLARYVVDKGSVTLDGVSLTVVEVGEGNLRVAVIPHTAKVTTLGRRAPGDKVNIEVDMLAKYVERLLSPATVGA